MNIQPVVIIGAGPAGLTAAYKLVKRGIQSVVLEKGDVVGGISCTRNYRDFLFDIGGHRFFTKVDAVREMWDEVLREDMLRRRRLSRIYYGKKFFYYPIRPLNALKGLGLYNSAAIFLSYLQARLFPRRDEISFEDWVTNRFGRRLYEIFFKSYTEKVWGMPCSEIKAEWAAQRIRGLSLTSAVKNALYKNNNGNQIKTLIDSFHYPRLGPGMMWEAVANRVRREGSDVLLNTEVNEIQMNSNFTHIEGVTCGRNGSSLTFEGSSFLSSMPIRELIHRIRPAPPEDILEAANHLKYRDLVIVALIVRSPELFPDNWIYIHDPDVRVGRIQNFKNWSPHMVPYADKSCLGLEYFCFEGDDLWSMPDDELVCLASKEVEQLGLVGNDLIEDGVVVRMPKAYPAYDLNYHVTIGKLRGFLDGIKNLQVVGRNGMHKYNNQDHSMLTAMLAVENLFGANHDLWSVNTEQEYYESERC
jgi:protoporphyrinogen oxidase